MTIYLIIQLPCPSWFASPFSDHRNAPDRSFQSSSILIFFSGVTASSLCRETLITALINPDHRNLPSMSDNSSPLPSFNPVLLSHSSNPDSYPIHSLCFLSSCSGGLPFKTVLVHISFHSSLRHPFIPYRVPLK